MTVSTVKLCPCGQGPTHYKVTLRAKHHRKRTINVSELGHEWSFGQIYAPVLTTAVTNLYDNEGRENCQWHPEEPLKKLHVKALNSVFSYCPKCGR